MYYVLGDNIGFEYSSNWTLIIFNFVKLAAYLCNDYSLNIQPYTEKNMYDITFFE